MIEKKLKKCDKHKDYYVNGSNGTAIHNVTRKVITIDEWKRIVSMNLLPFISWG